MVPMCPVCSKLVCLSLAPFSLAWFGLAVYYLAWHDSSQGLWLHPRGIPLPATETACLGILGQDGKADL